MKSIDRRSAPQNSPPPHRRWVRILVGLGALVLLVGLFHSREGAQPLLEESPDDADTQARELTQPARTVHPRRVPGPPSATLEPTAEEIVAGKLRQFTRARRELARTMAQRKGAPVPGEVEEFFDALEAGHWPEIEARFKALGQRSGQYEGSTNSAELNPVWCAVLDAYGAAEQVHEWPAQKLLDYGKAILDSLRPGMVYVGGTDSGRWIPELLNETSGSEPHIIVTQNALADTRYLEYIHTLYGERLATLTEEDQKRVFQEYMVDAQKRLEHDQQLPNEPKQVRAGEDIRMADGKVQVGGQVAVMAINEKLLQTLLTKNPELSFALQESSPLQGTYADALPLGPLMELRARDTETTFTSELATQSLEYWRTAAQRIFNDPEAANSPAAMKSYSHDAAAAANLLAAHNYKAEAEQAYRLGMEFWPENPEPVGGLAELLATSGRANEAKQMLDAFSAAYPNLQKDLERIRATWHFIGPKP